ncbi:hypothetical protein [Flavobacterium caeni]|uniref:DUF1735 domain-containing protein n=1 Tax=Flavobacterium caeni TaxID=490189 RepID=A0A1G5H550_9FLAO|nr:hypothetical protein [Flavobacterium caeni]SCY58068.1 hypothetical protein SAMN02927903_01740 [Flavobacterium caeni]
MKVYLVSILLILGALGFASCEDNDDTIDLYEPVPSTSEPSLVVKFKFDKDQVRLNNIGQPSAVASGNAGVSPDFNAISAHYFELAPNAMTQLGQGAVLYHAPETTMGGSNAIDFSQAKIVGEGETFLRIPLKDIAAGSYEWVRVSLAYQNYNIPVRASGVDYEGTLASFVGYNTYIGTHEIGNSIFPVNANRLQGYWAFALADYPYSVEGQAPAGATTVPNPIASTSPIPAGSCVVTGRFANNLTITGNETKDVVVTLSLSVNKSFEWQEVVFDGKYEPAQGETVVDMGLRGLIPSYQVAE